MTHADHAGTPWRDRLRGIAEDNRALFDRHPWVAAMATLRPTNGPGAMARYEHELRAFEGLGLDDVEMDAALTYLLNFVRATAQAAIDMRDHEHEGAMSDRNWWAEPILARVVTADAFPTAVRVGAAAGAAYGAASDPDHAYAFGLERVLDGLGVLTAERQRT